MDLVYTVYTTQDILFRNHSSQNQHFNIVIKEVVHGITSITSIKVLVLIPNLTVSF